jgi:hypothetical protein
MWRNATRFVALSVALLLTTTVAKIPDVEADDSTAQKLDDSLRDALKKADKSLVQPILDPTFTWTDAAGKTRTRSETLADFPQFATDNSGYADVKTNAYQQLAVTYGVKADVRFVRIWVKRSGDWRLYIDLDTPISPEPVKMPPQSTGDCKNPCRVVPYTPRSSEESALVSEWQKTKMDEWHPDAADWATHIADEFMLVNSGSTRNKTERVAFAEKLQAAGISVPGDPIITMKLEEFGDAMIMTTHHSRYRGGKPYYNVRIFVKRNGHWLLAWSQQTTIRDAADVPGVNSGEPQNSK